MELKPHPSSSPHNVAGLTVKWQRDDGNFLLRFTLAGPLVHFVIPEWQGGGRADGLWQSTCFEFFARVPGQQAYAEFNFSPSRQWAAYAFADYRDGQDHIVADSTPDVSIELGAQKLTCIALLTLPEPWAHAPLDVGYSAVIEEVDGTKSYWALAHPAEGPPDFHHPDCFALRLPAPEPL